ncbi:MAG TPA: hypothetical protein VFW64_21150 [Pseudonocardiaceae bacterium]|nr:hypothetical protein [Pseudonocardiaceae bacterium]
MCFGPLRSSRLGVGQPLFIDLHGDDSAAQVPPERVYASLLRALDPELPVADLQPLSRSRPAPTTN